MEKRELLYEGKAKRLFSSSAKNLAKEIFNSEVDDWWLNLWTADKKKS